MNKGILIDIEGIDGSGKATQAKMLSNVLKDSRLISFPQYGNPSATMVEMYLQSKLSSAVGELSPYAVSTFYSMDRYISYLTDWKKDYDEGKPIVADRYTNSNAGFQGLLVEESKQMDYIDWLYDHEYHVLGIPRPDVVVFLDVPTDVAIRYRRQREIAKGVDPDLHERDSCYQEDCRRFYLQLADRFGWVVIDCVEEGRLLPEYKIHQQIIGKLRQRPDMAPLLVR